MKNFLLAFVIAICFVPAALGVGGWSSVSVTDQGVIESGKFAVDKTYPMQYLSYKITSAEQQVAYMT